MTEVRGESNKCATNQRQSATVFSGESWHADAHLRDVQSGSHLEVKMAVLNAVLGGPREMEVLRSRTGLPSSVLKETTGSLLEAGLLTVEDGSQTPRLGLTEKAHDIVVRYTRVIEKVAATKVVIDVGSERPLAPGVAQSPAVNLDKAAGHRLAASNAEYYGHRVRGKGKEALAWIGLALFALVLCAVELVVGEPR